MPEPQRSEHLLIIGGGPAGLAAAASASAAGLNVTLVDDNFEVGGQIWRGSNDGRGPQPGLRPGAPLRHALARGPQSPEPSLRLAVPPAVRVLRQTRVVDQPCPGVLRAESPTGIMDLPYGKLLLATGARERFLPFPGWTLPHVLGAGGLQAMVKGGLPIAGKRVVVAGTGPLLLAVAAYLIAHGAEVPALCEQAGVSALLGFAAALPASKRVEGVRLARSLHGLRPRVSTWPVEARPGAVVLNRGGQHQREIACDYLACGYHLVPNAELAQLLGCATQNGFVVVNERQETTISNVYCAGEPTGIGGVELAQVEGAIAGACAAGAALNSLGALFKQREKHRRFAARLERAFALRAELRALSRPETIVCRCEDVRFERLRAQPNWRQAKLQTRCGMGPCQGRVCGPAAEFLFGWPADAVRPPIFPMALGGLIS